MAAAEEVVITISGDSAPLVSSLADASAAFGDMAASADAATTDIAATMDGLSASFDDLDASVATSSAAMDDMAASSAGAGAGIDEAGASAAAMSVDVEGLAGAVGVLGGAFDAITGQLGSLAAMFGTLIAVMGAMTIINDISNWIQNLISQMFQLDQQTQKTVNSWQYLFANAPGGGKSAAQQLAGWAYAESPNLPFTAMDLRSAISVLGTAGYSPSEIEQFIPYLADIASTLGTAAYGGQGVTLEQAANAIRSAGFGLTRMLRTDLGISPAQLVPYGLDATVSSSGAVKIKNMATLLPALEAFARGRGLAGAAQAQEVNTFWGAWSSFQDYGQNFLQSVGGINPQTGAVTPGSFFGGLQSILVAVNSALGGPQGVSGGTTVSTAPIKGHLGAHGAQMAELKHQAETALPTLRDVADVLGTIFGGAITSGKSLFEGLFSGLDKAGGGNMLMGLFNSLKDFGNWLTSAPIQKDLKNIGDTLGQFLGQALKAGQSALPDLGHAFQNLVAAWEKLTGSMSGSQGNAFKGILADVVEVTAAIVSFAAGVLTAAADFNQWINNAGKTISSWGTDLKNFFSNLGSQFQTWGRDLIQMLINGIQSMLPNLRGMINNIAQSIASQLHFSKPDEGPLADSDMWMNHMMNMFTSDIEHGIPRLAAASRQAAAAIAAGYGGIPNMYGGGSTTNYGNTTSYGGGNTANFNMYGNSQLTLETAIINVLQRMDQIGALKLSQPGGFYLFGMH